MYKKKRDRDIRGKVLTVFKENPSKLFNFKQIAAKLNIRDGEKRKSVIRVLGQLDSQKIISQKELGKYSLLKVNKDYIEGIIEMTSSGNAYLLMQEGEEDIFIARKKTNRSLDGDRVLVYPNSKRNKGKREGEVVEILERASQYYIGILERKKDFGFVNTSNSRVFTDFFIEKEELKEFENGDKVVIHLKDWPKKSLLPMVK